MSEVNVFSCNKTQISQSRAACYHQLVSSQNKVRSWLLLPLLFLCSLSSATTLAPNVIIVVADDLGWNDVGYHGSEIQTPRLDALAAEGIELQRFHTQPTCSPTRAALMTGKTPMRLGIFGPLSKLTATGLPLSEKLLPEYFKQNGYQTYLVGKWHLGFRQKEYLPTSRGFDHFYGHVTGGVGYWDHVHGGGVDWQRNGKTLYETGYATELEVSEAIRLIQARDKTKPLFMYTSFNAPHLPNEAPAEAIERYMLIDNPYRRVHAAMVSELDKAVGRLVDTLESEGILDNTLIWFMSDNGGLNSGVYPEEMREDYDRWVRWFGKPLPIDYYEFRRGNVQEGGSDNTPFRFGKGSVYEGGTRVPSIVYWRHALAPTKVSQMVTVQDVLPTLMDAAQLEAGADDAVFDGASMWPAISRNQSSETPDYITRANNGDAIYRYPWKLLRLKSGKVELYQLDLDPTEKQNMAEYHPEKVAELLASLESFPQGPSVHPSFFEVFWDPDAFGGEIDREPWTEIVQ